MSELELVRQVLDAGGAPALAAAVAWCALEVLRLRRRVQDRPCIRRRPPPPGSCPAEQAGVEVRRG